MNHLPLAVSRLFVADAIKGKYDLDMTLTLRDIPIELDTALRKRAAEQHRPVDQIAVEAMKQGLGLPKVSAAAVSLAEAIRARFGPLGGLELPEPIREPMREPLDFQE